MEGERRRGHIRALLYINLVVGLCVFLAVVLGLDRLGDRLTEAISVEIHGQMWNQINLNREEQAARMLQFEQQTFEKLEVQELQGEAWWRAVIKQHPELGDR